MKRFLIRAWIYPFYKNYSGLLFVVFLIAAGLLRGEEHLALALFFTSHLNNLVYPFVAFILYELLTIHFSIKWISDHKNTVIREILYLDCKPRFRIISQVIVYLHIPVMIYTIFLLSISISGGGMVIAFIIILSGISRIMIYTLIFNQTIINPVERQYKSVYRLKLPTIINYPLINFSVKRFYTQSFVCFLLSKLFSIGLLMIFIFLFDTIDNYDRFSRVAIVLVFMANAFLSYDLFKFHYIDLNVFRNLPFKPLLFLLQALVVLFILNLPEILLIYRNFLRITDPVYITLNIINGLAAILFLYSYLMYFNTDLKTYIIRLFWGSILLVLVLLFDFPVYLLFILLCSGIFYFYFKGYYKFELVYDQVNDK